MDRLPFEVRLSLPGWSLLWVRLHLQAGAVDAAAAAAASAGDDAGGGRTEAGAPGGLADLRRRIAAAARERFGGDVGRLAQEPVPAAVRALFRAAGCDPTRYRPSSEALLRRLLKGEELPVIQPLVDLNNCLSVDLCVPCGLVAGDVLSPPVELRAGCAGEELLSLRGPFNLSGKPMLADAGGPLGTPITDGRRGQIHPATRSAWLIVYLPASAIAPAAALARLQQHLAAAPAVATVELAGAVPAG